LKLIPIFFLLLISASLFAQELIELNGEGEILISNNKLNKLRLEADLDAYKEYYAIRGLYQDVSLQLNLNSKNSGSSAKLVLYFQDSTLALDFFINLSEIALEDELLVSSPRRVKSIPKQIASYLLPGFSSKQTLIFKDRFPFNNSIISIDGIIFHDRTSSVVSDDYGDGGNCQVNAICPIASNSELSRATTRILWINRSIAGWCTGSLINNTALNFKPYVLSAEHCALAESIVSDQDLNRWVFFFNYLNPNCEGLNQESEIPLQQIIGATFRARSDDNGGDSGSDFLLLELSQKIPAPFQAYFAGWNRSQIISSSGECFHHPAGDAQKISIYRQKPDLASFGGSVSNTHLRVYWQQSIYGFGTTEGGSSGSALLDADGLVIGTLTGGSSSCQQTELDDLYGRFAYSWRSNGNLFERQLAPWLDPINSGTLRLQGLAQGDSLHQKILNDISLFPNPIENGWAEITGLNDLQSVVHLQLFSFAGEELKEIYALPFANGTIPLNLTSFRSGLYILRIIQANQQKTLKIWAP